MPERPDIFKTQLRAILRASYYGKMRMMYPMVSGPGEFRSVNEILDSVRKNLREEGIPFDEHMEIGAMIEVPSAAMTADLLAKEAKFFSIGTNDLIQYTLAIDRVNEQTAAFYEPCHPGVLRLIQRTVEAAHANQIKVGLCGEMSSEPVYTLLLLGLGLDEFSMSPGNILQIKKLIRSVSFADAKELARRALELSTGVEVEALCRRRLQELAPSIINNDGS